MRSKGEGKKNDEWRNHFGITHLPHYIADSSDRRSEEWISGAAVAAGHDGGRGEEGKLAAVN